MITVEKAREIKERYIKEIYDSVRKEQREDQTYIDDTFDAGIKKPHRVFRSGIGRRMVDAPAEQIVTSNLQFFIEMRSGKREAGERISRLVNREWIPLIACQNPNPPKEVVKNKESRGESYIKVIHNESWVTGEKIRTGLPVHFLILDPMVIYGSPEEDERGIPERVVVFYERQPSDLIVRYPDWSNPKKAGVGNNKEKKVEWFEYWDKDSKYFEADGEAVTDGVEPNLYGFPPFVRKYSGFGKRSPDGDLKHLIVSDIRFVRDLIYEECSLRSDIASIAHLFAHKPRVFTAPEGVDPKTLQESIDFGAYGITVFPYGTQQLPDISPSIPLELLNRHREVVNEIAQRCPFIMQGFPAGVSGRQDELSIRQAMRRYDTVVENSENEWATAIWMALKICDVVPTLKPDGLQADDLKSDFECFVKLKASDPVEEDRLTTLGDRLWSRGQGSISLKTFHMQYQGMTEDEHEDEVAEMMADKLTLFNPDVAAVYGAIFGEESGLQALLEKARLERQVIEKGTTLQKGEIPPTTEQRIKGEAQTELGREMGVEGTRGARIPPERYYRRGP